jgi:uncharacterized membrane protein YcaP (DUF421 family)
VLNADPSTLAGIIVRSAAVYVALFLMLRIAGKRELGQMSIFDLVVVLVIANAVQNAMVGPDTSLTGGLVAAATLIVVNWAVNRLGLHSVGLGRRLTGQPTVLLEDGQVIEQHMRREGISADELMMSLRQNGLESPGEARLAILETNGRISVIPASRHAIAPDRRGSDL